MEYQKGVAVRTDTYIDHDTGVRVYVSYDGGQISEIQVYSWDPANSPDDQDPRLRATMDYGEAIVFMEVMTNLQS